MRGERSDEDEVTEEEDTETKQQRARGKEEDDEDIDENKEATSKASTFAEKEMKAIKAANKQGFVLGVTLLCKSDPTSHWELLGLSLDGEGKLLATVKFLSAGGRATILTMDPKDLTLKSPRRGHI